MGHGAIGWCRVGFGLPRHRVLFVAHGVAIHLGLMALSKEKPTLINDEANEA